MLLGRPWQFDLDATHGGRSNTYSFVHKGVNHVFKPIPESAIKAKVFATSKVKKKVAEVTPKPRTALLQEGENDVTVSARINAPGNLCKDPKIVAGNPKIPSKGEEDIVMINSLDNASESYCNGSEIAKTVANKSSFQSRFLSTFEKLEGGKNDEDIITAETRKTLKNNPKPRTALFQGGEDDEPMAPQFIRAGDDPYYLTMKFGALSFDVKGRYMKKNMPSKYVFIGANIREEVKKYAATLMEWRYVQTTAQKVDVT